MQEIRFDSRTVWSTKKPEAVASGFFVVSFHFIEVFPRNSADRAFFRRFRAFVTVSANRADPDFFLFIVILIVHGHKVFDLDAKIAPALSGAATFSYFFSILSIAQINSRRKTETGS